MYQIRIVPTSCDGSPLPDGLLTVNPLGRPQVQIAPSGGAYVYDVDLTDVEMLSHSFVLSILGFSTWQATVLLPDTLHQISNQPPPAVFEIPVLLEPIGVECENIPGDPCFVWLQAQCTPVVSFFPTFAVNQGTLTWTFGDGRSWSGPGGTSHQYQRAGGFIVGLSVERCDWVEEESCCGGPPTQVRRCAQIFECEEPIDVTSFLPEALFAIDCQRNAENNIRREADCIQGCYGCDCDDVAFCRCVAVNEDVRFVPIINFNLNHCLFTPTDPPGPPEPLSPAEDPLLTVRWFVNDELILEIIDDQVAAAEPFVREFDEEGRYRIRLEVCNCCGCCTFEETISVGPSLFLERTGCHTMSIVDFTNYGPTDRQRVTVATLDGKTVAQYLLPSNPTVPAVISVSRDGVYIVSVELIDPSGVVLRSRRFIWYEFCDLLDCYHELVRRAACTDCKCDDPAEEAEVEKKIDRFLMLAGAFFMSLDVQFGNTYGLLYYEERFLGVLRDHQALLEALLDLCGRCGIKVDVGPYKSHCKSCGS